MNVVALHASAQTPLTEITYDVVIYGDSSAAITAALQTARMGKRPLLIEPTGRLGGLTSSGLGGTVDTGLCATGFVIAG